MCSALFLGVRIRKIRLQGQDSGQDERLRSRPDLKLSLSLQQYRQELRVSMANDE